MGFRSLLPLYRQRHYLLQATAGLMQGEDKETGGEESTRRLGWAGGLRNWHHTHGVGKARARTPSGQDDDQVTTLEESTGFAWKERMGLVSSVEISI